MCLLRGLASQGWLGLRFDLLTCHRGAAPFSGALYDPGGGWGWEELTCQKCRFLGEAANQ